MRWTYLTNFTLKHSLKLIYLLIFDTRHVWELSQAKKAGKNSNKVLTFKREGPSLNQERALFSCGKMKDSKGNTICVVAGGDYGTCILDTVEILDTSRIDEGWSWGKLFNNNILRFFKTFIIVKYIFKKIFRSNITVQIIWISYGHKSKWKRRSHCWWI